MLDQEDGPVGETGPVALYERASARAVEIAEGVHPDQLALPTPCSAWTVQGLLDHLIGGTIYLESAISGAAAAAPSGATAADYRAGRGACLAGLRDPAVLSRTCQSPLGFDWTVLEATAGTFMDTLVHTWDLATATGQPPDLDPDLVEACIDMFLPEMPERGRAAGLIGPAVPVTDDATPQDRLLAAMGRRP
jgi:uncharacterized protein (TIGR03086 family)